MMVVALFALWAGGLVFAVFAAISGALVVREWSAMSGPFPTRYADTAAIVLVGLSVLASRDQPLVSVAALAAVAIGISLFSTVDRRMRWLAGGILYGGLPGIAAVALRGPAPIGEASLGLAAIAFVFGVVWATDTAAYFAGRTFGGPKLAPRFSPKKTWSGRGTVGAFTGRRHRRVRDEAAFRREGLRSADPWPRRNHGPGRRAGGGSDLCRRGRSGANARKRRGGRTSAMVMSE
jgi:phosphatidate cytidylyltransferase